MNGDIVRQGLGQIKGPGLVPILKGKTDPAILCHHSGFFVRPAAIWEITQVAAAVFITGFCAGPLHDIGVFQGNDRACFQIIIDAGTCPAGLVITGRIFVAMDQLCLNDLFVLYGLIAPDMRFHDPGNHLMAGSIGVQTVRHINRANIRLRRIQCAFCVQIYHRNAVAVTNIFQCIHIIAKGGFGTVRVVIVGKTCSQKLACSKTVPVQRGDKYDFTGCVSGNKCGNDSIQCTVEGPVLGVLHRAQRRFMAVVVGTHENDDQIRRRNALITVDQWLIALAVI